MTEIRGERSTRARRGDRGLIGPPLRGCDGLGAWPSLAAGPAPAARGSSCGRRNRHPIHVRETEEGGRVIHRPEHEAEEPRVTRPWLLLQQHGGRGAPIGPRGAALRPALAIRAAVVPALLSCADT